jgi:hypothetical protein
VEDAAADFATRVAAWPGLDCETAKLAYARKIPTMAPWSAGQRRPPVLEISKAGIDLRTGSWEFDVALDCSAAVRRRGGDRIWESLTPWWTFRRMEIGAEVAGAAGIALPYEIVENEVRPYRNPTPGLVSFWQHAEEQWGARVPAPSGNGIAGLLRTFRALGFHERRPSVSGTTSQILSLRSWVGEGEGLWILAVASWGLRVPLDAIEVPEGWEGKVEWRVDLHWSETPSKTIHDTIEELEMVLAASRSGVRMHVQMKGGLSREAGAWIATRLGAQAGRLDHG